LWLRLKLRLRTMLAIAGVFAGRMLLARLVGLTFALLVARSIVARHERLLMDHSLVPAKVHTAVARSGGPEPALGQRSEGLPSGWRVSASPWTAASTMAAALRTLGAMACIAAIFASSMLLSDAAHAERALSATHRAGGLSIDPFAAFVTEASKRFGVPEHWIRAVMHVESGGKLRARSQKGAPWG
jgi:soluble lytic murein transglycosylase-like protein